MKNKDSFIYPASPNVPYNTRAWDKIVGKFYDKIKDTNPDVPRLTPHEFRHTFGTVLRRKGVDIYTIQKLMGHKTIKVTPETYVHNEVDVLKRALGL